MECTAQNFWEGVAGREGKFASTCPNSLDEISIFSYRNLKILGVQLLLLQRMALLGMHTQCSLVIN